MGDGRKVRGTGLFQACDLRAGVGQTLKLSLSKVIDCQPNAPFGFCKLFRHHM